MSAAATLSGASLTTAQQQFTATLSAVEGAVHYAFRRRLRPQEYEEAMAEAKAAAWSAWHGLVKKGKDPVAVGVHGIATNAVRYVKNRRRIGNKSCGRGAMDVYHPRAQQASDFKVISLDSGDEVDPDRSFGGGWRGWLAEDNTCTPADQAAFHLDLEDWLSRLPTRKRRIAELLAAGHEGAVVARTVGVSPARVCQVRPELERSWGEFQGQAEGDRRRVAAATGGSAPS